MKKNLLCIVMLSSVLCAFSQNWDIDLLEKVNKMDGRFTRQYSRVVAETTPYIVVGLPAAMGIYALIDKKGPLFEEAVYIGTSVIEAFVVTYGMKYAVDRQRPYDKYPALIDNRSTESSPSFPSTHTASAFALATSLSITYPKWYVIAPSAVWACSVGFARMNQGVHYPSDVVTGAVVGAGCAVANVYVNRWLRKLLLPEKKQVSLVAY